MEKTVNPATQKHTAMKKRRFIAAFRGRADGNISEACRASGVGRKTYYTWVEKDKEFADAVSEMNESILDWGESRLRARMAANDTIAIIFFLKTKGKRRGYVERQEVTGAEGQPIDNKFVVEVVNVTGDSAKK